MPNGTNTEIDEKRKNHEIFCVHLTVYKLSVY